MMFTFVTIHNFSLDFANPAVQKNPHALTPGLGTRFPMLGQSARVVTADTTTKPRRSVHCSIGEHWGGG